MSRRRRKRAARRPAGTAATPPPSGAKPHHRRLPVGLAAAAALLLAAGAWWWWTRPEPAPIPLPDDASRVDPMVMEQVEQAVATVRADPEDGAAWGALGRLYHANEFFELARDCYLRAERTDGGSSDWPYFLAVMAAERGQVEVAVDRFERALALESDYAPAWARLGDARLANNDHEGAAEAYREQIRIDPSDPHGRVGLARIARRSGRLDDAVDELRIALELEPRLKEGAYMLAMTYRETGRDDEASALLGRFGSADMGTGFRDPKLLQLEREAGGVFAMLLEANRLLGRGQLDRAEQLYMRVLSVRPDEFTALLNLGEIRLRQRRYEEARRSLSRAVDLRPETSHGHFALALSLLALSDHDAGERELRETLRLDPSHAGASEWLRRLESGRLGRRAP